MNFQSTKWGIFKIAEKRRNTRDDRKKLEPCENECDFVDGDLHCKFCFMKRCFDLGLSLNGFDSLEKLVDDYAYKYCPGLVIGT